ncbi:hypothetical protein [Phenylobacterium aquaticum]|uniref:hypothetical protein n=1 Tax=Phenylobacterium aquaticum TaxID=1763816 RepID=UPI001F5C678D|nr:hypothetical protein [Phenylobacterium aquaticum]MCI3135445.1 hypothetical protein [Phenylobacterium aquaticum]
MNRKSVWIFAVIAATVAAMMAFSPPGDRAEMASLFGLVLAVVSLQSIPAFRRFVLRHVRWTVAIGISAIVLGLLCFVVPLTRSVGDSDVEVSVWAFILLLLGGVLTILMPSTMRRMEANTAIWNAKGGPKPAADGFDPVAEVTGILADLWGRKAAVARVVGPWLLLMIAIPLLLVLGGDWKALGAQRHELALAILLGFGALIVVEVALLFVAGIQWTRFTATKREPRLTAFPGKALWGWTWRWFIFGGLFQTFDRIEPWLKAHLPGATPWQLDSLQSLIGLVALVLASPFALSLPAIALNASEKGAMAWALAFRAVGRKFHIGAALILTPFALGSWLLDTAYDHFKGPVVAGVTLVAHGTLFLGTALVGLTYLTRVYLRGNQAGVTDGALSASAPAP